MPELEDAEKYLSKVANYYLHQSIFITGSSGFVGSVLLELLLRCFPGIKVIYILLRIKKNVQPEIRKEQIFNKKIFERLKQSRPQCLDKVLVIPGDISLPNLGMSDEDIIRLTGEVSIVFHCAACISLMKPLKFILTTNVLSLHTIISLCRKMQKFKALVYTSTAFVNCNHPNLISREDVQRLFFRTEKFLDALKNEDDNKLQKLFDHCLPSWPNTYLFSKCLAENLIMDTASDLPVAIVRPSVVFSTYKLPIPGYLEEHFGVMEISLGIGKGFIKVLLADQNVKLDLVPADIVANAHVLAAWSIGTKRYTLPLIVNCTATEKLAVRLKEYIKTLMQFFTKYPIPKSFQTFTYPIIEPNRYLYNIFAAYHHYLPAAVLDGALKIFGKTPRLYSLYSVLEKVSISLNFFLFHTLKYERKSMEYLDKLIHPDDRKDLSLDFSEATLREILFKIPESSPFYNWMSDKKSQTERQKIIYRRYITNKCIQGFFVLIICALIFCIFYSIFCNFLTED